MNYDEAKAVFFQELSCPEQGFTIFVSGAAERIRSHIEELYPAMAFDGKIQKALEQVIATTNQALEVVRALEQPTQEQQYKDWKEQAAELWSQVGEHFTHAHIQLPILSGGKRRRKYFIGTKLPRDSAIIAIESVLDALYREEIPRRRREYHAAGLLYYLGYEKFGYEDKLAGEPFPDKLTQEDQILRRYRPQRREAQKYLSREAVSDLMQQATQARVEHENQKALSRAILTELLRK